MSSETLASHITAPTQTFAVDPARVRILVAHARHSADAQLELIHTPLTGGALASLPLSTEADVAEAYTQAGDAQIEWARTSFKDRKRIMERFHDTVLDHQAEILDFIQLESGKSRGHAFEEVADVAVTARHYGRAASGYLKDPPPFGRLPRVVPGARAAPSQGCGGHRLTVELPLQPRSHGRDRCPDGGQRRRAAA
ncbi:UNVERIFIED_ORG: hypothetical protein ABID57_000560 [Arthrobacter sp. UYEF1]